MPDQPSSTDPLAAFGPNEWLVDELYQQYLQDKNAVDTAWWEFFEDYKPDEATRQRQGHGDRHPSPAHHAGPRLDQRRAAGRRGRSARREGPGHAARRARADPAAAAAGRPAAPAAKPAPEVRRAAPPTAPEGQPGGEAAAPITRTRPRKRPTGPVNEDEVKPLRGAGGPRRHQHGGLSLEVPTATSVRAVPAKLLIDNRVVINNHLARCPRRQGQLHPPHRLRDGQGPGLDAGDERRLRRVGRQAGLWSPAHVNLGLAIDLAKPDGSRALLVPIDQVDRVDGLRPLLDRLRGRRAQAPAPTS